MPWIAVTDDGRCVTPEQVDDGATVTCPDCGDDMFPRGPTIDGKARHFVHTSKTSCTGGSAGESDMHRRMKSQVISAVRQWFPDQLETIEPEAKIDTSMTASSVATRQADVHALFNPEHPIFGRHLAIEVQY